MFNVIFICHHPLHKVKLKEQLFMVLKECHWKKCDKNKQQAKAGKKPCNVTRIVCQVVLKHWNMYVWENPALAGR